MQLVDATCPVACSAPSHSPLFTPVQSSLIKSLFRIVEPCGGSVCLDGLDIGTLGLDDLRQSRVAIIPQDPIVFSGSVRYNLEYAMCSPSALCGRVDSHATTSALAVGWFAAPAPSASTTMQ